MLFSVIGSVALGGLSVHALDVGVAKLPVLGYNTWNYYQCDISEALLIETAQLMKKLGLQAAGYDHVNIDDCWSLKNRSSSGALVADPVKFPSGIKSLTTTLHKLGFKAGIYSDAGWFTCGGYPGSFSNEVKDAQTFSDWGIDYLKYDNCAIPYDSITRQGVYGRYTPMRDAIIAVAKKAKQLPIVFSLCEWGWDQVWLWGKEVGQSWRVSTHTFMLQAATNSFITTSTDYYGRNDLDMLQIGNGNLTYEEKKSHWTAWALMKSPLFIGTNLSAITPDTLSILTNREIIAINQDPVYGESISPFRWGINPDFTFNATHPAQYWSGRSQNGTVIMMLNTLNEPASMTFNLTETPWIRAGRKYTIRDLWSHTNNGTAVRNITRTVPAHGVLALLLKDAGNEPSGLLPECSVWWQCTDRNGTRVGG
ncbi:glycoside hydrolase [Ceratobasidium sp. AG-I]|nr:glycoside hydrolase [Ceratobasidium sp. AG-I]